MYITPELNRFIDLISVHYRDIKVIVIKVIVLLF